MDINAINKMIKLNENKYKTKIPEACKIRGVGIRVGNIKPIIICRRLLSKL